MSNLPEYVSLGILRVATIPQSFISDLWENGFLGRSIARIHVIQLQKLGYPQTHIILTVPQVVKSMMSGTMTLQSLLKFQICNLC